VVYKTSNGTAGCARRSLTRLAAAGLSLAIGGSAAFAAEDALLSRLQGDWVGQGTVRMNPSAAPERIYCKIANKLVDQGSALEQKGRCAVATNSGRLRGKIASLGQGRYEGSLDSPQTKGPAVLAGRAEADRIFLSADFVDRFSRQPAHSFISLHVGDGGAYRLVTDMAIPGSDKRFQTGDILFERDKK
jgi:hypothetical protein